MIVQHLAFKTVTLCIKLVIWIFNWFWELDIALFKVITVFKLPEWIITELNVIHNFEISFLWFMQQAQWSDFSDLWSCSSVHVIQHFHFVAFVQQAFRVHSSSTSICCKLLVLSSLELCISPVVHEHVYDRQMVLTDLFKEQLLLVKRQQQIVLWSCNIDFYSDFLVIFK